MNEMKPLTEVAAQLGISEKMLYAEHKKGNLPLVVIGRNRFVESGDIATLINARRVVKPKKRLLKPETLEKMRANGFARRKTA